MAVDRAGYILGLTFEKNAPFKKLRVMLISEELLKRIVEGDFTVSFDEANHVDRWDAMKLMASIYTKEGTNNPTSCLWRVEIAVPKIPDLHVPGQAPTLTLGFHPTKY